MKKLLLFLSACLGFAFSTSAQWTGIYPAPMVTRQMVGIGTLTPTCNLHIVQELDPSGAFLVAPLIKVHQTRHTGIMDSSTCFSLLNNGFLGIGEVNPQVRLHVNGAGYFRDNVGLGTLLPQARLHVKAGDIKIENGDLSITNSKGDIQVKAYRDGLVWAREFRVNMQPIPDYVFADNYPLMSLYDLEQYIQTNRHLPGIPSANEYQAEGGVNMGELQLKLLEKIEELTLHLILLDKEAIALRREIEELKAAH